MASIGLAASIIELTNAGFSLGKFLNETWLSYQNAPTEVLEIAAEVSICCELMTPLGEQLKVGSVKYTSKFQSSVEALVKNSTKTFDNVRALIPEERSLDKGVLRRWNYVLKKSKIEKHRRRLKEIQQMFLFMKQTMVEMQPSQQSSATALSRPVSQSPVTLLAESADATLEQEYEKKRIEQEYELRKMRDDAKRGGPRGTTKHLQGLRQNPYFAPDLLRMPDDETRGGLGRVGPRTRDRDEVRRAPETESKSKDYKASSSDYDFWIPDDNEANRDVEELVASWFGHGEDRKRSQRPSLTVTDTSLPSYSPTEKTPTKLPSPKLSPSASPRSPRSPAPESYSANPGRASPRRQSTIFDCNGCDKEISGTRYECRSCRDYDLCKKCFDDPETTIRLKHRHPKSHFAEIRA